MSELFHDDFLEMPVVLKDTPASLYHELAEGRVNLEELPPAERQALAVEHPEIFFAGGQAVMPTVDGERFDA